MNLLEPQRRNYLAVMDLRGEPTVLAQLKEMLGQRIC